MEPWDQQAGQSTVHSAPDWGRLVREAGDGAHVASVHWSRVEVGQSLGAELRPMEDAHSPCQEEGASGWDGGEEEVEVEEGEDQAILWQRDGQCLGMNDEEFMLSHRWLCFCTDLQETLPEGIRSDAVCTAVCRSGVWGGSRPAWSVEGSARSYVEGEVDWKEEAAGGEERVL